MEKMKTKTNRKRGMGMETSEAKQMITLKNLPSNLVEEAIVVLKANQMVVTEYIRKLEKNDGNLFYQKAKLEKKCMKMRNLNIGLGLCLLLSIALQIFF